MGRKHLTSALFVTCNIERASPYPYIVAIFSRKLIRSALLCAALLTFK